MSIIWVDGFDLYGSASDLLFRYSSRFNALTTGRFGGQAGRSNGGTNALTFALPGSAHSTLSVGFAFRSSALSNNSTGRSVASLMNSTTNVARLGVDINGALVFGRGDYTTNKICNSVNGVIVANAWNYIELEFTRHASAGAVNVYCNGALVANASSVNTGASDIDTLSLANDFMSGDSDYDDFYVNDTATRLGECRIDTIRPSADSSVQWTHSTGSTNFGVVDDTTMNGDTDYNSDATVGHKDLFDCANLSFSPNSVFAVQVAMSARKDDATVRAIRHNMKNGSTTTNGTTRALSTTYNYTTDLYETNPDTAAAFTVSDVNAMQIGYEVVT